VRKRISNSIPGLGNSIFFAAGIFGVARNTFRKFFIQIKRAVDVVIAIQALILTLPLWILITVAIKLDSRGPVILKQERVGLNQRRKQRREKKVMASVNRSQERRVQFNHGRKFIMYKFRSMYEDAEKMTGPVWAGERDPRITRVGYLLRKTHLDELPQFINVIKGEMSLIGPRPERDVFVDELSKKIQKYHKRLYIKPGITGLAQVRQHYDSSLKDVKRKVHYDLLYMRRMCLMMDFKIIMGTILVMMTGKGAR
jgi:lipopolysaccharide/colanic/teichoic acid biosynthesis glycosyltransferase